MEFDEKDNTIINKKGALKVYRRVNRLIGFLNEYKELWYDNGGSFKDKVAKIASDEKESARIIDLYNQAESDYSVLRSIRSKFYQDKQYNMTPAYKMDETQIDALRQAGVGRVFGLSDENQYEYDLLLERGVDEDIVRFIFKHFSSYSRFKEIFVEAFKEGKEKELFEKYEKTESLYVSDIDISMPNGIRKTDYNYVRFLKDVFNVDHLVYDGTDLVQRVDAFLEFHVKKMPISLSKNEKEVIRRAYGLGTKKMSRNEIAMVLGISKEGVRKALNSGLDKLSSRRTQMYGVVCLADKDEATKFLINYFKNHDIFITNGKNQEIVDSDLEQVPYFKTLPKSYIDGLGPNWKGPNASQGVYYEKLMDNFEEMKFNDFYFRDVRIEELNLPTRVYNCLRRKELHTLGSIIEYSRKCRVSMLYKLNGLGEKTYNGLKESLAELGLKLEDEDKTESTRNRNNQLLNQLCNRDGVILSLYLGHVRYKAFNSTMDDDFKKKIENRIDLVMKEHGIRISEDELVNEFLYRIDSLDKELSDDMEIKKLLVPSEAIELLTFSYNIKNISDIYRLSDEAVSGFKKKYSAYFDMIVLELERMGLEYPFKGKCTDDIMKHATYMNETNFRLITFMINTSDISAKKKIFLMNRLKEKMRIHQNVDLILSNKIERLRNSYTILEHKKQELSNLENEQDNIENNVQNIYID